MQTFRDLIFIFQEALKVMSEELRFLPSANRSTWTQSYIQKAWRFIWSSDCRTAETGSDLLVFSGWITSGINFKLFWMMLFTGTMQVLHRSKGRIGLGFIGLQSVNVYVDGWLRYSAGDRDMFDIYLKPRIDLVLFFLYHENDDPLSNRLIIQL